MGRLSSKPRPAGTARHIGSKLSWGDVWEAFLLSLATMLRVALLIAPASLIWVPVGVWIGLRPRWAERVQPLENPSPEAA